jgi:hypothetical protein
LEAGLRRYRRFRREDGTHDQNFHALTRKSEEPG